MANDGRGGKVSIVLGSGADEVSGLRRSGRETVLSKSKAVTSLSESASSGHLSKPKLTPSPTRRSERLEKLTPESKLKERKRQRVPTKGKSLSPAARRSERVKSGMSSLSPIGSEKLKLRFNPEMSNSKTRKEKSLNELTEDNGGKVEVKEAGKRVKKTMSARAYKALWTPQTKKKLFVQDQGPVLKVSDKLSKEDDNPCTTSGSDQVDHGVEGIERKEQGPECNEEKKIGLTGQCVDGVENYSSILKTHTEDTLKKCDSIERKERGPECTEEKKIGLTGQCVDAVDNCSPILKTHNEDTLKECGNIELPPVSPKYTRDEYEIRAREDTHDIRSSCGQSPNESTSKETSNVIKNDLMEKSATDTLEPPEQLKVMSEKNIMNNNDDLERSEKTTSIGFNNSSLDLKVSTSAIEAPTIQQPGHNVDAYPRSCSACSKIMRLRHNSAEEVCCCGAKSGQTLVDSFRQKESKSDSLRNVEYWIPAQASNVQLEQYCAALISNALSLCSSSKRDTVDALYEIIIRNRKCCDHPYIVDPSIQEMMLKGLPVTEYLDVGIKASGKLQLLDSMLSEIKNRGLRVLILFQSIFGFGKDAIGIGDILDDYMRQRFGPDSYERIDVLHPKKQAAIDKFNNKESGRFVLLLEARASGPSIKLASIDAVIIYGSDWIPAHDYKNLQKISFKSQFDQMKVFRLYTSFTLEEKVLSHVKQNMAIDSIHNMFRNTNHKLLMWGAINLFKRLEDFHGSNEQCLDASIPFQSSFLKGVLKEFSTILDGCNNTGNCSIISTVKHNGSTYSLDNLLFGETEIGLSDEVLPHLYWTRLLEGRNPQWKHVSCSTQRNRKRVHYMDNPAKKLDVEIAEASKKRKKVVKDQGYVKFQQNVAKTCYGNLEGREKMRYQQKSFHHTLQSEVFKLCKALQLSDDVKGIVEKFLAYVMTNHHVPDEPTTVTQSFQVAMCWTAASLLKQKIDHKASLAHAKEHFNYECTEEDAERVYSKLRCLKSIFLFHSGHLKVADSSTLENKDVPENIAEGLSLPFSCEQRTSKVEVWPIDKQLSGKQYFSQKQRESVVKMVERDVSRSLKKIDKKCKKKMSKLLRKQEEERKELLAICEEDRELLEKTQKLDAAVIRLSHETNAALREDKLKSLDDDYNKRYEEHEKKRVERLRHLDKIQHAARKKEEQKAVSWVEEVTSWAHVEILDELSRDDFRKLASACDIAGQTTPDLITFSEDVNEHPTIPEMHIPVDVMCQDFTEILEARPSGVGGNLCKKLSQGASANNIGQCHESIGPSDCIDSVPRTVASSGSEEHIPLSATPSMPAVVVPVEVPGVASSAITRENAGADDGRTRSIGACTSNITKVGQWESADTNVQESCYQASEVETSVPSISCTRENEQDFPMQVPEQQSRPYDDGYRDESHDANITTVTELTTTLPITSADSVSIKKLSTQKSIAKSIEPMQMQNNSFPINVVASGQSSCEVPVSGVSTSSSGSQPQQNIELLRSSQIVQDPMQISENIQSHTSHNTTSETARILKSLHPSPLQNELERIRKEIDCNNQLLQEKKLQLESDCEKEIAEVVAQIRQKYDVKYQDIEAEYGTKSKELERNHDKVLMNKILAEAFKSKCSDVRPPSTLGLEQDRNNNFRQQLARHMSSQQTSQGPSSATITSVGHPTSTSLTTAMPHLQHTAPTAVSPMPPTMQGIHHSSAPFLSIPPRPTDANRPSPPTNTQLGSEIRTIPPHLQRNRSSVPSSISRIPLHLRASSNQPSPNTPSVPVLLQPPPHIQARPCPTVPYVRPQRPEISGGLPATPNSSTTVPSENRPLVNSPNILPESVHMSSGLAVQSKTSTQNTAADIVCLSDDE